MTHLVEMKSKTTLHNPRIVNDKGGLVEDGDLFHTDPAHARDLVRLGHAEPTSGSIHDIPDAPLAPHHTVSAPDLRADRHRRFAGERGEIEAAEADLSARRTAVEAEIASLKQRVADARANADDTVARIEKSTADRVSALGDEVRQAEEAHRARLEALKAEAAAAASAKAADTTSTETGKASAKTGTKA